MRQNIIQNEKTTMTTAKKAAKTKKDEKKINNWTDKISQVARPSKSYSTATLFNLNDLIDHPSFGAGVVTKLQGSERIEVTFSDGIRSLVHNK